MPIAGPEKPAASNAFAESISGDRFTSLIVHSLKIEGECAVSRALNPLFLWSSGRKRGSGTPLETTRLGEIDPETIAAALIVAGHLSACVAQLLLHKALVHLG